MNPKHTLDGTSKASDNRLRIHELGFMEAIDRPSPEDLRFYYSERYFEIESGNYRRSYTHDELNSIHSRVRRRSAHALQLIGRSGSGKMLDVGCGEGFVLAHFAEIGWEVSGIDFSRSGVEAMNPGVAHLVESGDLFERLGARTASGQTYDVLWLENVLEHVLDPVALLGALEALLTNDGLLVVTVPNDGTHYQEDLLARGQIDERWWINIPDHLSYFDAPSLKAAAEATGWQCLDIQADFPIDWFLALESSNYVRDPSLGAEANNARIQIERAISANGDSVANKFYSVLAELGLGRNITVYLKPDENAS